ncbi:MAG: hypothetical protein IEMM0002_1256 [bacterium]|nr:MAG: hypothetical protein IEMM0002_1256 [bacterium]
MQVSSLLLGAGSHPAALARMLERLAEKDKRAAPILELALKAGRSAKEVSSRVLGWSLSGEPPSPGCYLQHRASYDLDFFVNARFDPFVIQRRLSVAGVGLKTVEIVDDPMFATQLHGTADVEGEPLRVSIVEDIYADMFPVETAAFFRKHAHK